MTTLGARIRRALGEEVENLNLPLCLANLLVRLLPSTSFSRLRTSVYRLAGFRIGPRSLIFGRLSFTGQRAAQSRLTIGADTMINEEVFMDLNAPIHIGDGVSIGHHVMFITTDHEIGDRHCRAGKARPSAIHIGNGSWVGARSTILPGVRIGEASIVAAASLVSGSVPADRMVGGVPARPLKSLAEAPAMNAAP